MTRPPQMTFWISTALLIVIIVGAGEVVPSGLMYWFLVAGTVGLIGLTMIGLTIRKAGNSARRHGLLAVAVLVLTCLHLLSGPLYYRSGAISARVVANGTGSPIAGAVVRAEWRLVRCENIHAESDAGVLHSERTLTGSDGRFVLRAWGPKWRPPYSWLDSYDPRVEIVSPQGAITLNNMYTYVWFKGSNVQLIGGPQSGASVRLARWSGFDIAVPRYAPGDREGSSRK